LASSKHQMVRQVASYYPLLQHDTKVHRCMLIERLELTTRFHFQSVTLHTTLGDLKLEIFCEQVPLTAYVRIEDLCGHVVGSKCPRDRNELSHHL
jgi:hypothetical protein